MFRMFEFLVNIFQSFAVTHFLIKCLGVKNSETKPILEYITGVTVTLIYLEILNRITPFESIGIFVYMIISMSFSIILLRGSIVEKLFYNLLMIGGLVFSALLGGGIVGMLIGRDYLNVISLYSTDRYIALILTQFILCIVFVLIIKLKTLLHMSDTRYMKVLCVIPIISIIICCLILFRNDQSYTTQVVYTMLAIMGIFAVNAINLILLAIEHRIYAQRMQDQVLLNAYEQKEKDVDSIKMIKIDNDKFSHEMKKILTIATELVDNGDCKKASDFLHKFIETRNTTKENVIYSNNVILNYMLNRKIKQCEESGIDISCFINGIIDGVEDVDLYILLENLIDNGIEASVQTENAKMHLNIYADEHNIEIEIGNSTKEDILKINPDMKTTKKDKTKHGYGLQNVREVVQRYNGKMEYRIKMKNYIVCRITLKKTTIHV